MIILFNKKTNPNITSIDSAGFSFDKYYWATEGGNYWCINESEYTIMCPGEDVVIHFNSLESMQPYIQQMIATDVHVIDPAVVPVNTDPYMDKPKTGSIVSHTYARTDIEKSLIQGD